MVRKQSVSSRKASVARRTAALGLAGLVAATWASPASAAPASPFGANTQRAESGSAARCTFGEVILSAGRTTIGIPANGQLLPISRYSALFALLGNAYGGDGRTTFGPPDLADAAPNGLTYSICADDGYFPTPVGTPRELRKLSVRAERTTFGVQTLRAVAGSGRPCYAGEVILSAGEVANGIPAEFGSGTQAAVKGEPRPNDGWTMGQVTLTAGRVAGGIPANGQSLATDRNLPLAAILPRDYLIGRGDRFRLPDLDDAAPDGLTYAVIDEGWFPF